MNFIKAPAWSRNAKYVRHERFFKKACFSVVECRLERRFVDVEQCVKQGRNYRWCNAPGSQHGGPELLHFIVKYFC